MTWWSFLALLFGLSVGMLVGFLAGVRAWVILRPDGRIEFLGDERACSEVARSMEAWRKGGG